MCCVCVAEEALWATRCKDETCMAYRQGERIHWHDAPPPLARPIWTKNRPAWARRSRRLPLKVRKKLANRTLPLPFVCVRAKGSKGAEGPGRFQIRLSNEKWPKEWTRVDDVATAMSRYGLDSRWDCVPKQVQDWVRGKRRKPSWTEMERWWKKRIDRTEKSRQRRIARIGWRFKKGTPERFIEAMSLKAAFGQPIVGRYDPKLIDAARRVLDPARFQVRVLPRKTGFSISAKGPIVTVSLPRYSKRASGRAGKWLRRRNIRIRTKVR